MKTIRNVIHIFLLFALVNVFQAASAQPVSGDRVTAVPTAVDFGIGATIGVVRLSVLRGWEATPVFALVVTSLDSVSGTMGFCQLFFSDTNTFGFDKSQAIIGVPFEDPMLCPGGAGIPVSNGATLTVCAKVQLFQDGEYVDFTQEVCATLDPN